jgi:hypothetical protein
MLPGSTEQYVRDVGGGYVELSRQCPAGYSLGSAVSDLAYYLIGQFRHAVPSTVCNSSLLRSILHVVGCRTQEQVIGTYTVPYIASVAHAQSGRYRTVLQFVRQAVCSSRNVIADVHVPVPPDLMALPQPARLSFIYEFPEALRGTFSQHTVA